MQDRLRKILNVDNNMPSEFDTFIFPLSVWACAMESPPLLGTRVFE